MDEINYDGTVEETTTAYQGAEETETAEPSQETQEVTTEPQGAEEPGTADQDVDDTDPSTTSTQSSERDKGTDAIYAAARRKAEADAKAVIAKAQADAQAEAQRMVDATIAQAGYVNQATGQPIRTKAELDAYTAQVNAQRRAKLIQDAGISEDDFKGFIEGLPEVQAAKAQLAKAKEAQALADKEAARVRIEDSVKAIHGLDPTVNSLNDVFKHPKYGEIEGFVKRGMSLEEAFKLANFDTIKQTTAQQARTAGAAAQQGKNHLTTQPKGRGSDTMVAVPKDVMAMYKAANRNATAEEIQRHYNQMLKG